MLCIIICTILTVTYWNYTDAIGWGVSFRDSNSLHSLAFKVTFVQYWNWLRHMNGLSVFRYGFFIHADIRHSFTIPKGLLLVLYSNGLAKVSVNVTYPWPWYLPSRICLNTPPSTCPSKPFYLEFLGATDGRSSAAPFHEYSPLGGVFFGGVVVVSLDLFDLSFGHCLTNRCSLLGRIPYSTCPSNPFLSWVPRSYRRKSQSTTLFPSTLLSEGRQRCLTRPAVLCSPACVR